MINQAMSVQLAARRLIDGFARAKGDSDEAHDEAVGIISIIRADERAKVLIEQSAELDSLKRDTNSIHQIASAHHFDTQEALDMINEICAAS